MKIFSNKKQTEFVVLCNKVTCEVGFNNNMYFCLPVEIKINLNYLMLL